MTGSTRPAPPRPGQRVRHGPGLRRRLTPRYFDVDLDKNRPIARAAAGNDAGTPIPAVRMPHRVSATDPEVLRVTARTGAHDCLRRPVPDRSSAGRSGTVRIDDRDRPFHTSGTEGPPRYEYDTAARRRAPRTG
ncbi:hypothetical protein ACFWH4_14570 [Streptomyces sp. NPDC127091]|uniref:hypothetical protein n=1 Tax=Streptomyces sp. NPDC127091 TaxID=3347134 RepID=UPI00365AE300